MCQPDGSCGCGCPTKGGRRSGRRSSGARRDRDRTPSSYRFATAAALVRNEGMQGSEARDAVDERSSIIDSRMRQGMSPASTARFIATLSRRSSRPPSMPSRDPDRRTSKPKSRKARARGTPATNRKASRPGEVSRPGEMRVSEKGHPYRVCPRGTRIQTIIFPLSQFTQKKATAWVRKHGFRVQKLDVTSQSIRIRQQPVELFVKGSFRTITLPSRSGTIRAVIGCPRFAILAGGRRGREREVRIAAGAQRQRPRERRRAA